MRTLKEEKKKDVWLTQKNLADRWHVSQGTIISWRDAGKLPYFRLPGTNKILYSLQEIQLLEEQHTTDIKEDTKEQHSLRNLRKNKPVVSDKPTKVWRV